MKIKCIIISILITCFSAGVAFSAGLSPVELKAMLEKVEAQGFDARDTSNKPVKTEAEKIAGIFRFVERIQSLKAQIETPTAFGTVLSRNNVTLENTVSNAANLVVPSKLIKIFQFPAIANSATKRWLLSYLPVQALPAGLSIVAISFLMILVGTIPSLSEPRFRFSIQLE